jgi:hypothetical protein
LTSSFCLFSRGGSQGSGSFILSGAQPGFCWNQAEPTKGPQFLSAPPDFTLRFTGQDGQRYYGERFSPKSKETVLGMIDDDGKSIYMVDDGDVFICTYDEVNDSLMLRYMEPGK